MRPFHSHPAASFFATLLRYRVALAVIFAAAFSAALILVATGFRVESSADSLVLRGDDDLRFYQETRVAFASDEFILCSIESSHHFTPRGVATIERLTHELEQVAGIRQVISPTHGAPLFFSREGNGPLAGLNRFLPAYLGERGVSIERARRELIAHPVYRDNLVSADGRIAAALAFLEHDQELLDAARRRAHLQQLVTALEPGAARARARSELEQLEPRYRSLEERRKDRRFAIVAQVRGILAEFDGAGCEVHASGVPVVVIDIIRGLQGDLVTLGAAALLFLLCFLLLIFRSVRWTILPLIVCAATVLATLAIFFARGNRLTIVSANLPPLLFVLGLGHALHIHVRLRERCAQDPAAGTRGHLVATLAELWRPCFYTSATTMVGFASLLMAGIRPVEEFGWHMALGVAWAFVISFTFLPAAALGWRPPPLRAAPRISTPLRTLGTLALRRRGLVLLAAGVLAALAVAGITRLRVETRFIDYFGENTTLYRDFSYLDRRMGGTMNLEVVLSSPERDFFRTSAGLEAIGRVDTWLGARAEMGAVNSIYDFAIEGTRILAAGKADPARLEEALKLIETVLAPATKQLYLTSDGQRARIIGRVHESRADLDRRALLRDLQTWLVSEQAGLGEVSARPTGMFLLYTNVLESLTRSQLQTALVTAVLIFLMLALSLRDVRAGLLGLLPSALTIAIVLGAMGWMGIHLDVATVMIASISFGIAVDAAIHYLFRFRQERRRGCSVSAAVLRAHSTIGISILYTSLSAVVAFWVFTLSNFRPNVHFGLLTGLAMVCSLLATLTLLPALLPLARPFEAERHAE